MEKRRNSFEQMKDVWPELKDGYDLLEIWQSINIRTLTRATTAAAAPANFQRDYNEYTRDCVCDICGKTPKIATKELCLLNILRDV